MADRERRDRRSSGSGRRRDGDRRGRGGSEGPGGDAGRRDQRRRDGNEPSSGGDPRRGDDQRRRRSGAASLAKGGSLPQWVRDDLVRVTPKTRVPGALQALEETAEAFVRGRYHRAVQRAQTAKKLAPRDATIRELLGLSAYRAGDWDLALRELRTYRRLTGDTLHLPVEMDCLRALSRHDEVEKAFADLGRLGGSPGAIKEGKVVFASHLLDRGEARRAWQLVEPKKITADPFEEDLRLWYVASRAAAALGDTATARRLLEAITAADPAFPGMDELDSLISETGNQR